MVGPHSAALRSNDSRAGAFEPGDLRPFVDPHALLKRHAAQTPRETPGLDDGRVGDERTADEPGRVRDGAAFVGAKPVHALTQAALRQKLRGSLAGHACLPLAGASAEHAVAVEPRVDFMVGAPALGFFDRVGDGERVAKARLFAEQAAERRRVLPRRGEEAAVAPARAASTDVLFEERDAHARRSPRELDRGPQPREASTDDAHVGPDARLERGHGEPGSRANASCSQKLRCPPGSGMSILFTGGAAANPRDR